MSRILENNVITGLCRIVYDMLVHRKPTSYHFARKVLLDTFTLADVSHVPVYSEVRLYILNTEKSVHDWQSTYYLLFYV